MGHEVVLFGIIEGVSGALQERNEQEILGLVAPEQDEWPWLNRAMFALPGPWPQGTYVSPVIHFGGSLKDDPDTRAFAGLWIAKLEAVLRRLFWVSAQAVIAQDLEGDRMFEWVPTRPALDRMLASDPQPIQEWQRREIQLPSWTGE